MREAHTDTHRHRHTRTQTHTCTRTQTHTDTRTMSSLAMIGLRAAKAVSGSAVAVGSVTLRCATWKDANFTFSVRQRPIW